MSAAPPPPESLARRATLIDVARRAGVSPATVSNAINGRRYVEAGTRLRIEAAISELGYIPNLRARGLRTGKANTIALFSSMPAAVSSGPAKLGFMMEVAMTAALAALEKKLALILVPPQSLGVEDLEMDGALVIEPCVDDPYLSGLRRRGVPVVSIGRPPDTEAVMPFVDLQSAQTAALLLAHLSASGARDIALFIGDTGRSAYQDTEQDYLRYAAQHGIVPRVYRLNETDGEQAGFQAALALRRDAPQVDGVLILVDTFAAGAVRAFTQSGVSIPQEMRIATRYDGIRARETWPGLTAVNLHLDDVARLAIDQLFLLMSGQTPRQPCLSRGAELVIRGSTRRGPPVASV
ncbi:Putative regulatory protein, LacI family [Sodalis praecaptivus]|uniref:Putative regulatory protein, LacI family n=1 Tax=Sodalis praecaptivus TaxID=1239307 RepID=W0HP40_9GAMM|nr:LacI family DNA-binding transcriptional regulator [Sodalis praecaptivus]AHF75626.1 Putative regulatory protein, LacI family [Sodalis praecaptivus]